MTRTTKAAQRRLERIRHNKIDRATVGRYSCRWHRLFDKSNRKLRNRDYYFYQSIPF